MEGPGRQVFSVIRADRGKAGYRVAWEKRQKEERLACITVSLLHPEATSIKSFVLCKIQGSGFGRAVVGGLQKSLGGGLPAFRDLESHSCRRCHRGALQECQLPLCWGAP